MKTPAIITLLLTAATTFGAPADSTRTTIEAQLRSRAEYRNGAVRPQNEGDKAGCFINDRARLAVQLDRGNLSLRVAAQHAGVWGQDPQTDKQGQLALHEAWARLNFADGFFAQIGRQQLAYDDQRLLGADDWLTTARHHDALRVGYAKGHHTAHALLAYNQVGEVVKSSYYDATEGQPYKAMQALWYHYDGLLASRPVAASLIFMNTGYEYGKAQQGTTDVRYLKTFGTHLTAQPLDDLHLAASLYLQRGNNTSAWMASIAATYQLTPKWQLTAAFDRLSGEDGTDNKFSAFDPLYGSHHDFYGAMDLFYTPKFSYTDLYGLQDIHATLHTTAVPRMDMALTYHYFTTGANMQGSILGLGHELDYKLSTRLANGVNLSAGYSCIIGNRTLDILKGGDHTSWQDWAWLMIDVNL